MLLIDHISHHIFTLYALGASPAALQEAYDDNIIYQRPQQSIHKSTPEDLADPATFAQHLGDANCYRDYLLFFQSELDCKGYEAVVNEYIFSGDARAEDMLVRLHAGTVHPSSFSEPTVFRIGSLGNGLTRTFDIGFLHPLIHLGFGIEFHQPAMIAEALAETAVHENWLTSYYQGLEASNANRTGSDTPTKSLPDIIDDIRSNSRLSAAAHWDDGNKIRDGVLARASREMIEYAAQWTVNPEEIERKLAEMTKATSRFLDYITNLYIISLQCSSLARVLSRSSLPSIHHLTWDKM